MVLRGVMGVGAALVMPTTLSIITSSFPADLRGRAVGAWVGVAGAGAVFGLLVSGALLEVWDWPSVFLFNAVVAAVVAVGCDPEGAELTRVASAPGRLRRGGALGGHARRPSSSVPSRDPAAAGAIR